MLAYLGYLKNIRTDVADDILSLHCYKNPSWFAGFISYLMAREVGRGHLVKHVSLAKKINNYMVSGGWVDGWGDLKFLLLPTFNRKRLPCMHLDNVVFPPPLPLLHA